ncbi:TPA: hypothetical protein U5489_001420 [Legionella pneumophila]|nr:hypothetical protein [Legionella pneumophila]
MKSYGHLIPLSQKQMEKIWNSAIIIPDTNFLLEIYRLTNESRESIFTVLTNKFILERLWLPYYVGLEFHKNRLNVVLEQTTLSEKIMSLIKNSKDKLIEEIKKEKKRASHPFISIEEIESLISTKFELILEGVQSKAKEHPNLIYDDAILSKIHQIFNKKVGDEILDEDIKRYQEEAKEKYKLSNLPGSEDQDKSEEFKYGDYIIWKEILNKSKKESLPIIFITNDEKKDWWEHVYGRRIGISFNNRKEFLNETGQEIILYTGRTFINKANNLSKETVIINQKNQDKLLNEMDRIERNSKYHYINRINKEKLQLKLADEFYYIKNSLDHKRSENEKRINYLLSLEDVNDDFIKSELNKLKMLNKNIRKKSLFLMEYLNKLNSKNLSENDLKNATIFINEFIKRDD